jgi:hypothetical protein
LQYLTSFPTAIFTVLLVFCVAWWVMSLLFSAADFGTDSGDGGGDGDGIGDQIGRVLGSGPVPIPLAVTILAFAMWASSLVLQAIVADDDSPRLGVGIALLVIAVAVAVGLVVVRQAAKPLRRLFHTEAAPSRRDAVGSICKIRTVTVAAGGQAEIVNGGLRGSLIAVRAASGGPFQRGDHALIVDYDDAANRYLIAEIDEEFVPGT